MKTEESRPRDPQPCIPVATIVCTVVLAAILCFGFALRTAGLFHGLDSGRIYHPDTSKQMAAANRFMEGTFYYKVGLRDYDGYPYFNSLLAAGIRYPFHRISCAWQQHVQQEGAARSEPPVTFAFVRVLNAVESTLAVLLIFVLGRMLVGPGTGLLAAAMLACSPIDITTCHYANGDTAAALFGLLALIFAVRIYRHGKLSDYILATAFSVCSFSSKYYGTASAIPIIAAHLLRIRSRRDLFSKPTLMPIAIMGFTAIAAFFCTTPGAFRQTRKTVLNIYAFMQYTSGFKMPEQYDVPIPQRFLLSMKANLPVFVDLLGPVILVLAAIFLVLTVVRRNRSHWVIASLPLFYIFVGLTMKPAVQPVYHTVTVPALILGAAVFITQVSTWKRLGAFGKLTGFVLTAAVLLPLANAGSREALLFRLPDTRVLAKDWVENNVPTTFRTCGSKYSFIADDFDSKPGPFEGVAWVRSDFREYPEEGDPLIHEIALEDDERLVVFRNLPTQFYLSKNPLIKEGFTRPLRQRLPAVPERKLIMAEDGAFYHTTHYLQGMQEEAKREVYSDQPLEDVLVVVRGGTSDARVEISLGGANAVLDVPANTAEQAWLRDLRPGLPRLRRGYHYPLRFRCSENGPLICLAFSDNEKDALLQPAAASPSEDSFEEAHGMSPSYLNRLPYIQLTADMLTSATPARTLSDSLATNDEALFIPATTNAAQRSLHTDMLRLEPGEYTMLLHADLIEQSEIETDLLLLVMDCNGQAVAEPMAFQAVERGGAFIPLVAGFNIGLHPAGVRCRIDAGGDAEILIERIDIFPRPVCPAPPEIADSGEAEDES